MDSMEHNNASILQLVDFVVSHYDGYTGHERTVEKVIKKALEYDTFDYGLDTQGVVYVLRFNVSEDGKEAYVIDLIIRENRRQDIKLVKYIIGRNWIKFPSLDKVFFDRFSKYPYKKRTEHKLIKFFNKGDKYGRRHKNSSVNATASTFSGSVSP